MARLAEQFVYQTLAFTPVAATAAGYHTHRGVPLDQLLDDMSEQSFSEQREFYQATRKELAKLEEDGPDPEMDADGVIIRNQVELIMLELTEIQSYKHNPTLYVETVGNGLFNLYALESAPKEERFRNIIARLEKVPSLMEQAKANLVDAPEIWNKVAREENQGNLNLIDQELRQNCPDSLKDKYTTVAAKALGALKAFQEFLTNDLSKKTSDWRLGNDRYAKKFRYSMVVDSSSTGTLSEAQTKFNAVRNEMEVLASDVRGDVRKKLDQISKKQSTVASYFTDARADLEGARAFVKKSGLLQMPASDNLQVIETPEFMRGIYAVGGFNPAPAQIGRAHV